VTAASGTGDTGRDLWWHLRHLDDTGDTTAGHAVTAPRDPDGDGTGTGGTSSTAPRDPDGTATPDGTAGPAPDGTPGTGAWYRVTGAGAAWRSRATWLLLAGVFASVGAMSWSGLFGWFTGRLGWSHGHALIGPLALDAAAVACLGLANDRIDKGESGAQFRAISLLLVALSAFINLVGALPSGDLGKIVVFPAMSLVVYWIAHGVMGARRRDIHRAQHGQSSKARSEPMTRYDLLAWVMFPWATWCTLRGQVRDRLARQARPAAAPARETRRRRPAPDGTGTGTGTETGDTGGTAPDETGGGTGDDTAVSFGPDRYDSIAEAARAAAAHLAKTGDTGITPARVAEFLSAHGRPGTHARQVAAPLRRIHLVTAEEAAG